MLWQFFSGGALTLILAFVIAFRRPGDSIALVGAWFLASMAIVMIVLGQGSASVWRRLPVLLGLLLWPAFISRALICGIGLTFVAIFPPKAFSQPMDLGTDLGPLLPNLPHRNRELIALAR